MSGNVRYMACVGTAAMRTSLMQQPAQDLLPGLTVSPAVQTAHHRPAHVTDCIMHQSWNLVCLSATCPLQSIYMRHFQPYPPLSVCPQPSHTAPTIPTTFCVFPTITHTLSYALTLVPSACSWPHPKDCTTTDTGARAAQSPGG